MPVQLQPRTPAQLAADLILKAALAANDLGLKGTRITALRISRSPDNGEDVIEFEAMDDTLARVRELQEKIDTLQHEREVLNDRIQTSTAISGRIFKVI